MSRVIIIALAVLLTAYDLVVYNLYGTAATLSKAMQGMGLAWPILIVIYGGLGAHFFWPKDGHWCGCWHELKPFILLNAGALVFRLAWAQSVR